ncbi:MAG TPA: glycosyltransferase family 4 protein [Abditibacteriaceae bacterium]|nr:glycosyltransferase family 4 protein [Abditibacteriaceae bacterium]
MNVAIFASAFYPHIGGVEELVRQLAHAYRAKGVPAIVLTNRWPRSLPSFEEYEGIALYRLPMRVPEGGLKARLNYRLTHAAIDRRMIDILIKHSIDLLHVQCVSSNGYYALLAKRALHLPLIVTTQGERTMDAAQIYQHSAFMNHNLRELLAGADYITACSQHTLDDMENYWGESLTGRAGVVYNGIQLSDFEFEQPPAFAHPKPYILGIGRLVSQKGFDVLIKAFAKADVPAHDLLLAGEGPERGVLETLAQKLGLAERVRFLGRADRPTAVALFKGCAFFVLPSRHEPQGIVNLEAMAAGKAVIAARVGGVPEIVVDGETGVLVPGEDDEALAQAIACIAHDTALRQRLGAAGQRRARQFDWSRIAQQYLDIYATALSKSSL